MIRDIIALSIFNNDLKITLFIHKSNYLPPPINSLLHRVRPPNSKPTSLVFITLVLPDFLTTGSDDVVVGVTGNCSGVARGTGVNTGVAGAGDSGA